MTACWGKARGSLRTLTGAVGRERNPLPPGRAMRHRESLALTLGLGLGYLALDHVPMPQVESVGFPGAGSESAGILGHLRRLQTVPLALNSLGPLLESAAFRDCGGLSVSSGGLWESRGQTRRHI